MTINYRIKVVPILYVPMRALFIVKILKQNQSKLGNWIYSCKVHKELQSNIGRYLVQYISYEHMLQIPPILKTHVQTILFQTHIRRLCLGLCNVNSKHKIHTMPVCKYSR